MSGITVNAVRMVTAFFLRFLVVERFNNRATYIRLAIGSSLKQRRCFEPPPASGTQLRPPRAVYASRKDRPSDLSHRVFVGKRNYESARAFLPTRLVTG